MSDYLVDLLRFLNTALAPSDGNRMFFEPYTHAIKRIFASFADLIPTDWTPSTHPFLYLVLWHLRILSYFCLPQPNSQVLLGLCRDSTALLIANGELVTPLNHHFSCLTSMALIELCKVDETQEDALKLLKDMGDSKLPSSPYDRAVGDKIMEPLRPTTTGSINSQNLQHLANLATATNGLKGTAESSTATGEPAGSDGVGSTIHEGYRDLGFDPRPLLKVGYLNYFDPNGNE